MIKKLISGIGDKVKVLILKHLYILWYSIFSGKWQCQTLATACYVGVSCTNLTAELWSGVIYSWFHISLSVFYRFCCTPWGLPRWWYLGCHTESSRNLSMTSPCWELLSLSPYDRSSQSFVDLRSRHLAGFITVNTEQILIAQWDMQSCGVWLNWSCGEWFCFIFLE